MSRQYKQNWRKLVGRPGEPTDDRQDLLTLRDEGDLNTNASGLTGFPIGGGVPNVGDVLKFTGAEWTPQVDASGASGGGGSIGVSVGASGTAGTLTIDYPTLGEALAAGQLNITVVSDTMETGDITVVTASGANTNISILNGAIVNMQNNAMSFQSAGGSGPLRITGNGKIHWDAVTITSALRATDIVIEGITLEDDNTSDNPLIELEGTARLNNVKIKLGREN